MKWLGIEMCQETPEVLKKMAEAVIARHLNLMSKKETPEFSKWWHGKIAGWFEAADGDLQRTRKLLDLPPCTCLKH